MENLKKFKNKRLDELINDYNTDLTNIENHDPITLFSAYMLGACGPDFWTVTSKSRFGFIPDTAGIHFDLGHYNRTHRQFQVAIKRWQAMDKNSFQVKVEQAYFYGMATHMATDCVMHQLVNVYAGAYHLLKPKNWENEHGYAPINLWNTHNKVEHYWDSYIRYRYLGDTGPIFENNGSGLDRENWMTPLGMPTTETIIKEILSDIAGFEQQAASFVDDKKRRESYKNIVETKKKLLDFISKDSVKFKIEQPFILPRIFCDRMLKKGSDIKPFIYDIVVDKVMGSYEEAVIFKDALEEKESYQMRGPVIEVGDKKKQTYTENKKINYFSTENNKKSPNTSFNYLNYIVCPNLDNVRKYGWNDFYHAPSLKPFIHTAVVAGKRFISDLSSGINAEDPDLIGVLKYFWNLDTGLGLIVKNLPSDTKKEVITELDFIHITEGVNSPIKGVTKDVKTIIRENGTGNPQDNNPRAITFTQNIAPPPDPVIGPVKKAPEPLTLSDSQLDSSFGAGEAPVSSQEVQAVKEVENPAPATLTAEDMDQVYVAKPVKGGSSPVLPFETHDPAPFNRLSEVFETDKTRYLDKIRLNSPEASGERDLSIATFYSGAGTGKPDSVNAPTGEETVVSTQDVKHRLTLRFRVPIAELHDEENLGFFLTTDKEPTLTHPKGNKPESTENKGLYAWANDNLTLGAVETKAFEGKENSPSKPRPFSWKERLCVFKTSLLANLEHKTDLERLMDKGSWNNVIPYSPHVGKHYNRNYAVGTGRENVIVPRNSGNFIGKDHFNMIENLSPTEQTFLTLHSLAQTPSGCFDVFSKKPVIKSMENDRLKIDTLGRMKLVFYFGFTKKQGAAQAKDCYVDGLQIPVTRIYG